jgi:RNA polymerase sigma-70 factor (ECF subfamily)
MKLSKNEENRSRNNSEHEETELILHLKKGDHKSFESLYCLYKDKLYNFLLSKTGSNDESKDIVQETFMKIWIEKENIDERKNFNGYIFKIAKNCMIDYYRKYSREKISLFDLYITKETPEDILIDKEKQLSLQDALNQLSPQQRKIYKLHYEQKKPLKEVANKMNLSLSTIQNHINMMIKNIIKYLAKKSILDIGVFLCSYVLYIIKIFYIKK